MALALSAVAAVGDDWKSQAVLWFNALADGAVLPPLDDRAMEPVSHARSQILAAQRATQPPDPLAGTELADRTPEWCLNATDAEIKADGKWMHVEDEHIRRMPRWAQLAFACRCAERAKQVMGTQWPSDMDRPLQILVEAAKSGSPPESETDEALLERQRTFMQQDAATLLSWQRGMGAAEFVSSAVRSIGCLAEWINGDPTLIHVLIASSSGYAAVASCAGSGGIVTDTIQVAARRDLYFFQLAARAHGWTDDTPVAPETAGPLWHRTEQPPKSAAGSGCALLFLPLLAGAAAGTLLSCA